MTVSLVYVTTSSAGVRTHTINLRSSMRHSFEGHIIYPTTDGRYVFWSVPTNVRPFQAELVGYDTQIQSRFLVVASATGANLLPHTRGGVLVWSNQSLPGSRNDYTWSISSASVRDVLPSARRNPLTTASPDVSYFGETGHNLAFGFKAFWERSGGLPVFGYPLTEEFAERNRDTGSRTNCQTRFSKP